MNIGDALTAAHFADGRRGAWVPYLQGEFDRHKVLCAWHPAIGLRGSGHFSQANEYLEEHDAEPIDWLDVCHGPQLEAQDAADPLTSADAEDEARWDRAFANSTSQLDQLAAQAREERRLGQTEELDPSRL